MKIQVSVNSNNKRYDINVKDPTLRTFHMIFNQFREERVSYARLKKIEKIIWGIKK